MHVKVEILKRQLHIDLRCHTRTEVDSGCALTTYSSGYCIECLQTTRDRNLSDGRVRLKCRPDCAVDGAYLLVSTRFHVQSSETRLLPRRCAIERVACPAALGMMGRPSRRALAVALDVALAVGLRGQRAPPRRAPRQTIRREMLRQSFSKCANLRTSPSDTIPRPCRVSRGLMPGAPCQPRVVCAQCQPSDLPSDLYDPPENHVRSRNP